MKGSDPAHRPGRPAEVDRRSRSLRAVSHRSAATSTAMAGGCASSQDIRAYFAWGFGGQYIILVPDLDLVVVTTSASTVAEDRRSHRRTLFELVEDLVIAPVATASAG